MTVVEGAPPSVYCTSVIPKLPLPPLKKGWAKGSRTALLGRQLNVYSAKHVTNMKKAVNWANSEAVNEYFAEFHWRLALDQESQPDDLPFPPDENLSEEEREWKAAVIKQMSTAIPNWLDYHWSKGDSPASMSKKQAANDPIVAFLSCLARIDVNSRQRALTAEQLFGKDNQVVSEAFNQHWKEVGGDGKARAGARTIFVGREFAKLSTGERKMWKAKAAEDVEVVKKCKEATLKGPTLLSPEETQKAMDSLAWMMGLLLDGLITMLGCHASLIITGPEPRKGGQINVLTLHHGYDKSPVPQWFHEAGGERGKERYKMFLAAIGDYIATCYTKDEQRARALPDAAPPNKPPNFLRWDIPWNLPPGEGIDVEKTGNQNGASKGDSSKSQGVSGAKKAKKKGKGKKRARTDGEQSENEGPPTKKKASGRATKTATSNNPADKSTATQSSQRRMLEDITNQVVTENAMVEASNDILITNTIEASPLTDDESTRIDPSLLASGVIPGTLIPNCGPNDTPNPFVRQSISSNVGPAARSQARREHTPDQQVSFDSVMMPPSDSPGHLVEDDLESPDPREPKWFKLAQQYLGRFELGKEWDQTVAALMALESRYAFKSRKPLQRMDRPCQVDLWIQNARAQDPPTITNRRAFTSSWWCWWWNMQPVWRGLEGKGPVGAEQHVQDEGDWAILVRLGQNGMYSVVASLAWWGKCVECNSEAREEWMMAMEDVTWVMECIMKCG